MTRGFLGTLWERNLSKGQRSSRLPKKSIFLRTGLEDCLLGEFIVVQPGKLLTIFIDEHFLDVFRYKPPYIAAVAGRILDDGGTDEYPSKTGH